MDTMLTNVAFVSFKNENSKRKASHLFKEGLTGLKKELIIGKK